MNLDEAIHLIHERWPDVISPASDEPVFVLGAGWRCGSTMLQRMLLQNCLVWGEPFGSSGLIERLSQTLRRFGPNWPRPEFFLEDPQWDGQLGGKWTANLYPSVRDLLESHVEFFQRLLAAPSQSRGFSRWGLKEVRYGIEHAIYLRWLFPRGKFLFLLRNPYECWASYRLANACVLRFWPEELITTPEQFGLHWVSLAEGFHNRYQQVEGQLLRYEALLAPDFEVQSLEAFLGFRLDMTARDLKVGGSPAGIPDAAEMARLHQVVHPLAKRLGYANPYGIPGSQTKAPKP